MSNKVALYHRVMRRENFKKAAKDIFDLLKSAQVKCPNMDRVLYVDIDGHKNHQEGFDRDTFKLQKDFGVGFLGKFFSEVHFPIDRFHKPKAAMQRHSGQTRCFLFGKSKQQSIKCTLHRKLFAHRVYF